MLRITSFLANLGHVATSLFYILILLTKYKIFFILLYFFNTQVSLNNVQENVDVAMQTYDVS